MSNAEPELNFMDKLWEAANRLRGSLDTAEYKHGVLGFIFSQITRDALTKETTDLEGSRVR